MRLVAEILVRSTGLTALRERVDRTADQIEKLASWSLELDRRVTRLEAVSAPARGGRALPKPAKRRQ